MSGNAKTFKVKEGDIKLIKLKNTIKLKDNKDNKVKEETKSFRIDDEKLLEKYKAIWTKIENLKNIKRWQTCKNLIRTFSDKVYTDFHGLNVPEDDVECESFTVISIDSLLVYDKKYYLQVYLDNCAYKIVNKQMADYLDENLFED